MSDKFELEYLKNEETFSNERIYDLYINMRNRILENEEQNRRRYIHLLVSQIIIVAFSVVLLVTIGVYFYRYVHLL